MTKSSNDYSPFLLLVNSPYFIYYNNIKLYIIDSKYVIALSLFVISLGIAFVILSLITFALAYGLVYPSAS